MAAELAVGYVSIVPSTRGMLGGLQRELGAPLTRAGREAGDRASRGFASSFTSGVSNTARAAGRTVAVGFTVASAATAALGGAVLKVGVSYNTLEQTSRAAFKTILGSADAANTMMDNLAAFAKTSPFPRQAFINATRQMLGFGFAAEDVIPTLGIIQDAVAAIGGGAPEIQLFTEVFSTIKSTGRVMADDLNRLSQVGVNAWEILAEASGMSIDEMRKSVSAGSIDAATAIAQLTEGMQARFEGAAANIKSTWVGATDRVKGAFRDIASGLVGPFVEKTGGGVAVLWANQIADAMRSIEKSVLPTLVPIIGRIAEALGGVIAKVTAFAQSLDAESVQRFVDLIQRFAPLALAAGTALATLGARSIPIFGGLAGSLSPVIGAIGALVATSPELRDMFSSLGPVLSDLAGTLTGTLKPVLPVVGSLLATLGDAAGQIVQALAPLLPLLATLAVNLVSSLAPILPPIVDAITQVASALGGALTQSMAAIIPAVQTLADAFLPILPIVAELAVHLVTGLAPVLPQLATAFADLVIAVAPLIPQLVDLAVVLLDRIGIPVIVAVATAFAGLATAITPLITNTKVLTPLVYGLATAFVGFKVVHAAEVAILGIAKASGTAIGTLSRWKGSVSSGVDLLRSRAVEARTAVGRLATSSAAAAAAGRAVEKGSLSVARSLAVEATAAEANAKALRDKATAGLAAALATNPEAATVSATALGAEATAAELDAKALRDKATAAAIAAEGSGSVGLSSRANAVAMAAEATTAELAAAALRAKAVAEFESATASGVVNVGAVSAAAALAAEATAAEVAAVALRAEAVAALQAANANKALALTPMGAVMLAAAAAVTLLTAKTLLFSKGQKDAGEETNNFIASLLDEGKALNDISGQVVVKAIRSSSDLSSALHATGLTAKDLANAIGGSGKAYDSITKKIAAYKTAQLNVLAATNDVTEGWQVQTEAGRVNGQAYKELQGNVDTLTGFVEKNRVSISNETKSKNEATAAARQLAAAERAAVAPARDAALAQDQLRVAATNLTTAITNNADKLLGLQQGLVGVLQSAISLRQGLRDIADAQKEATSAAAEFGATSTEAAAAQDRVASLQLAQIGNTKAAIVQTVQQAEAQSHLTDHLNAQAEAQAALTKVQNNSKSSVEDVADAQDRLQKATVAVANSQTIQRTVIGQLAARVSGPLHAALVQYLKDTQAPKPIVTPVTTPGIDTATTKLHNYRGEMDKVKPVVASKVDLQAGDALTKLALLKAAIQAINPNIPFTAVIRAEGGRAAGGPVRKGSVHLVGEEGPEFVQFAADGYVFPHGQTPVMPTVVPMSLAWDTTARSFEQLVRTVTDSATRSAHAIESLTRNVATNTNWSVEGQSVESFTRSVVTTAIDSVEQFTRQHVAVDTPDNLSVPVIVTGIEEVFRPVLEWLRETWKALRLPAPRLPGFARGGVVKKPTVALIGENRRTTPEVVSPIKLMAETFRVELARARPVVQNIIVTQERAQAAPVRVHVSALETELRHVSSFVRESASKDVAESLARTAESVSSERTSVVKESSESRSLNLLRFLTTSITRTVASFVNNTVTSARDATETTARSVTDTRTAVADTARRGQTEQGAGERAELSTAAAETLSKHVAAFETAIPPTLTASAVPVFQRVVEVFRPVIDWLLTVVPRRQSVPALAHGAAVSRPLLALVGEDSRTTPEIVSPVKLMAQTFRTELVRARPVVQNITVTQDRAQVVAPGRAHVSAVENELRHVSSFVRESVSKDATESLAQSVTTIAKDSKESSESRSLTLLRALTSTIAQTISKVATEKTLTVARDVSETAARSLTETVAVRREQAESLTSEDTSRSAAETLTRHVAAFETAVPPTIAAGAAPVFRRVVEVFQPVLDWLLTVAPRRVPALARGAVVKRPQLALIGEDARTTPEIVSPIKLMAETFRVELARAQPTVQKITVTQDQTPVRVHVSALERELRLVSSVVAESVSKETAESFARSSKESSESQSLSLLQSLMSTVSQTVTSFTTDKTVRARSLTENAVVDTATASRREQSESFTRTSEDAVRSVLSTTAAETLTRRVAAFEHTIPPTLTPDVVPAFQRVAKVFRPVLDWLLTVVPHSVPALAQGGVASVPMLALVGDSTTPEIVSPVKLMAETFKAELARAGGGGDVNFYGPVQSWDDRDLARRLFQEKRKEEILAGV